MLPRYRADYRTLAWVLAMPLAAIAQYANPGLIPYLTPLCCYLALAAGVMAHNHNHCPTFCSRKLNALLAYWLSLFYGYPTFAWIPTHNLNHHKYVNKAGDATITWRYTNRNEWLVASTYFFVSAYWQSDPIKVYIRKARQQNRPLYLLIVSQYVIWGGFYVGMFALACALHGWKQGALVWVFALGIPAFFALWTIMLFNYIQHVHTDPWSRHNHSRSFTGKALNFLLFNNGFHAAHHETPGAHWSTLPALHQKIASEIAPELQLRSFASWLLKSYLLGIFEPRFRTRQFGRAPFDAPGAASHATDLRIEPVGPGVHPDPV
jgi:fatty acid desaturase